MTHKNPSAQPARPGCLARFVRSVVTMVSIFGLVVAGWWLFSILNENSGTGPLPTASRSEPAGAPEPQNNATDPSVQPYAKLSALNARVLHRPVDMNEVQTVPVANPPRAVGVSDGVSVAEQGRAELAFPDALLVHIFHDTELEMRGVIDQQEQRVKVVHLHVGTVLGERSAPELAQERVRLETRWAVITAIGTKFLAHYNPQTERTWVVVIDGEVELGAAGTTVSVMPGWQSWVPANAPPQAPLPASRVVADTMLGADSPATVESLTGNALAESDVLTNQQCTIQPAVGLNLRQGPGTPYARLETMGNAERFEAIMRNKAGTWLWGVSPDGTEGWTSAALLDCAYDIFMLPIRQSDAPTVTPTPSPTVTPSPSPTPTDTSTPTTLPSPTNTPTPTVGTPPPPGGPYDNNPATRIEPGRTGNAVTDDWFGLDFRSRFSETPVVLAAMQSYDGADTAAVRVRDLDAGGMQVKIEEEQSRDDETTHTSEIVGYLALEPGTIYDAQGQAIGVAGLISSNQPDPDRWWTVEVGRVDDPVVFMQLASFNGTQPAHMRVRNVTSATFQYRIEEWDTYDQEHTSETLAYVVLERGLHQLAKGVVIEVGTRDVGITNNPDAFDEDDFWFDVTIRAANTLPVVFSQVQTHNDDVAVVTRHRNVRRNSFQVRMQEEEDAQRGHADETIGYMAVSELEVFIP